MIYYLGHRVPDNCLQPSSHRQPNLTVTVDNSLYYNNTLWFEGNTLVAGPEGVGVGRTSGFAFVPSDPVPKDQQSTYCPQTMKYYFYYIPS